MQQSSVVRRPVCSCSKAHNPAETGSAFLFQGKQTHNREGDILLAPGILLIPGNIFTPEKLPESHPQSPRAPPQVSVVAEHSAQGSPARPSSEPDSLDQSPQAPSKVSAVADASAVSAREHSSHSSDSLPPQAPPQVSVVAKNFTEGGPARSSPGSVSLMQET